MKKRGYLENAALLTVTGLALRAAGMFLRVYIAGNMGSAGVGLYQLIFTAYGVFIAAANSGVSVTAARLTAEELGRSDPAGMLGAMRRILAVSLGLGLCWKAGIAAEVIGLPGGSLGERLYSVELAGCALMLAGMLITQAGVILHRN